LSWLFKTGVSDIEEFGVSMPGAYMYTRMLEVFAKSADFTVLVDFESIGNPDGE
jgi:hypothetical protein